MAEGVEAIADSILMPEAKSIHFLLSMAMLLYLLLPGYIMVATSPVLHYDNIRVRYCS